MTANRRSLATGLFAASLAICCASANAATITWEQLKTAWQDAAEEIELAGFLLPVDYEGDKVYQFMLLPWAGACSHMPPPPPEQVVLVTPEKPIRIERTYEPVSVSGRLRKAHDISQLFILDGVVRVESGYRLRAASVRHADVQEPATAPASRTPWKFLDK